MKDRSVAAALTLATGTGLFAWRAGLGLWGAIGTDAPLWGLTAEGLLHGAPPLVPPAYPLLLSLLRRLGMGLIGAGSGLSLVIAAAIPGVVYLAARATGAHRRVAIAVALVAAVCPDVVAWSAELQSNGLVALGLAACTGLWVRVLGVDARWGSPADSAPAAARPRTALITAVVFTGMLPLLRENAVLTTAAATGLALLLVRGGWRLAVGVALVWWLSPLLAGQAPGMTPLDTPWSARGGMALSDLATGQGALPNYVGEISPEQRGAYIDMLRSADLPGLAWWHARRSVQLAPDGWLIAAAAVVAALAVVRRRPAAAAVLLPLATIGPALLIWTQRRHVMLAVPALLIIVAAVWPQAGPRRRGPAIFVAALLGLALLPWPGRLVERAEEQQGSTRRAVALAEFAAAICAEDPQFLGGPIQDVGLYCPRPRHEPDGSDADWHTVVVAPAHLSGRLLGPTWKALPARAADLAAYRLVPEGQRPCAGGRAAPGSAWLATEPVHATMIGCDP